MAHYGSGSPKRQKAWTNNRTALAINAGRLTKVQKSKLKVKTTVRTAGGGYQGSAALKATQMLSRKKSNTFIYVVPMGYKFIVHIYIYI